MHTEVLRNSKPFPKAKRGNAVRVLGLTDRVRRKLARACALNGVSQSEALKDLIRDFIQKTQNQFGDLFTVLTPREQCVLDAVRGGAARVQQVAEETGLTEQQSEKILDELNGRGYLDKRRAIKTTEQARGATVWEYFAAK